MAQAACESLQHMLDNSLNPCKHIPPSKFPDDPPTNSFSGFSINERSDSISISSPDHTSESLSEALGFESFGDVEEFNDQWEGRRESVVKHVKTKRMVEPNRSRITGREIPPPISSIGRRVCFKSYRYDGRLVVKEEKIRAQEILHAYREDGRLKLQFIHFDDDDDDDVDAKPEKAAEFDNGNDDDIH